MADDRFWRDLADRFLALEAEGGQTLSASWHGSEPTEAKQWHLQGASERVQVKFKWLAERAIAQLDAHKRSDGLMLWVELLRNHSPDFEPLPGASRRGPKTIRNIISVRLEVK